MPESAEALVLRGGDVIDGTGAAARRADVAIVDGRIGLLEPGATASGRELDVAGLVVSPGFIDTHAHADVQASVRGDVPEIHRSRLLQGVTTEVAGNCGFSPFPIPLENTSVATGMVQTAMGPSAPVFADFDAYAAALDAAGPATNLAPLVGQGALRAGTLGFENRPATDAELDVMRERLRLAMDAGAFGLSTGLVYTPATYTPEAEVMALVAVLAETGGVYATHIRNETDGTAEAIREAIRAGVAAGVPVHISHLKLAGERQWGGAEGILAMIEDERARGADVTADVYPYAAASTSLHSTLPPWTAEGGIPRLLERLTDPEVRRSAHADMVAGIPGWQNLGTASGWDRVVIAYAPGHTEWVGSSIAQLREDVDTSPVDTIARVVLATRSEAKIVLHAMHDDDVARFLAWEHTMIGSDGLPLPGRPHPRVAGTFPRVLGRHREALGGLEAAVHRMTGASARRFSIPERGEVADGLIADLVVFDPETIIDRATYEDPYAAPDGIRHVFMAGRPALLDGEVVDDRAGRVLRRGR